MPRASSECEFTCPNCGSTMVAAVPGEVKCSGEGCPYRFRVFSKRDKEKATDFYLTQPSNRLKYLKQAEDKRYFVAFCDKVEPFIAENLLDLINPKALQTIQMGLSERLQKPMTIMVRFRETPAQQPGPEFPVQITERNSQVFGRVDPVNPGAHFCERCRRIRDFPNGEQACLNYDMDMTRKMMETDHPIGVWAPCWAGLVDYAIPVVINDFVAAVLITGQIRRTDAEGEPALLSGSEAASKTVPLTIQELQDLADDVSQSLAVSAHFDSWLPKYQDLVQTISNVAESRYWAEKRARQTQFLTEVRVSFAAIENSESLWKVLDMVLERVNEFAFFRYSAFMVNDKYSQRVFTAKRHDWPEWPQHPKIEFTDSELQKVFEKEALFSVRDAGETKDEQLYNKIRNYLGATHLNCAFLFPCRLSGTERGILLLAERTPVLEQEATGEVSGQMKAFLEEVAHEIRIEVQNVHTISQLTTTLREEEELMGLAKHVLVAPLDSAYGKTEHLVSLAKGEPTTVLTNAPKILDLCQSIDEDIIRCVRNTRSFLFFTSIGKESEIYRFHNPIKLDEVLKKCVDDVQYLARKRGITIMVNAVSSIPEVNFDEDKIGIAFSNLLDNAVKYSHANKVVNVSIQYDRSTEIYTISVSDFGLGIPESEQSKIFEPYYRSMFQDPSRFVPGTGIGLAVVKQIVSRHGGKVWVTSKQGEAHAGPSSSIEGFNTTFWIQINRKRRRLE